MGQCTGLPDRRMRWLCCAVAVLGCWSHTPEALRTRAWGQTDRDVRDTPWEEDAIVGISGRASNGVCFGGGGNRAFAAAVGTLSGLRDIGALEHTKYVTGVSGSSWAVGGASSSPLPLDMLLLDPGGLRPETLDLITLGQASSSTLLNLVPTLSSAAAGHLPSFSGFVDLAEATNQNISRVWDTLKSGLHPEELWIDMVEFLYFERIGIQPSSHWAWNDASWDISKSRNPSLQNDNITTIRSGFPFPIIPSMIMGPTSMAPLLPNVEYNAWTLLEFTPLYAGVPFSRPVTFRNSSRCVETRHTDTYSPTHTNARSLVCSL